MKQLKDLKEELLQFKLNNFYVFYGEDFGIKHHYIERVKLKCDKLLVVSTVEDIYNAKTGYSLFPEKNLYVVLNDMNFSTWNKNKIQTFIDRLQDDILIVCYEQELPNTDLFKEFGPYITYFPRVKTNIATQFIDSEVNLSLTSKEDLAYNCECDYGTILLECDKIKNYAQDKNVSHQEAYESLMLQNQLIIKIPEYDVESFMNDILCKDLDSISYWYSCIVPKYTQEFWMSLSYIFTNLLIAYLVKHYGKYDGSSKAYSFLLPWNRTKTIRELNIAYTSQQLLDMAYKVCEIDSMVKQGKLQIDDVFNYFICYII